MELETGRTLSTHEIVPRKTNTLKSTIGIHRLMLQRRIDGQNSLDHPDSTPRLPLPHRPCILIPVRGSNPRFMRLPSDERSDASSSSPNSGRQPRIPGHAGGPTHRLPLNSRPPTTPANIGLAIPLHPANRRTCDPRPPGDPSIPGKPANLRSTWPCLYSCILCSYILCSLSIKLNCHIDFV